MKQAPESLSAWVGMVPGLHCVGGSLTPCSPQLSGGAHPGAPDAVSGLCVPAPEGPYACAAAGAGPAGGRGKAPLPMTRPPTALLLPPRNVASCPSNLAIASPPLSVTGAGQSCRPATAMRLTPCLWTGEGELSPRDRSW